MIRPGLVSVTFRQRSPSEVVELAVAAGVEGIEWGGDIHVPHGDLAAARRVGGQTRAAGLDVAAYGSYYRVGDEHPGDGAFEEVLETALALGAPLIRVWPGARGSADAEETYRRTVVEDSQRIADLAYEAGLTLAYEHHENTLTDTTESTMALLRSVDRGAMRTLWQPPVGATVDECLHDLRSLLPWLTNVHVFHVWPTPHDRHPLATGRDGWLCYLDVLAENGGDHWTLLEFVRDSDPATFREDAATLIGWLQECTGRPL